MMASLGLAVGLSTAASDLAVAIGLSIAAPNLAVVGAPSTELVVDAVIRILGFGLLAAGTTAIAAFVYRWYSGEEIPEGIAVLVGVTVVAVWLNTKSALGDAIIGETPLLDPGTAVYTVAAFAASAIAADGGRRLGDYLGRDVFAFATPRTMDDVSQLVRTAGRTTTLELPSTIDDLEGYDPVDAATKADLEGESMLFPRGLSTEELRGRLTDRLKRDYGFEGVAVEFTEERTIGLLAVGSRRAGIGPTLAPGTVVLAIRADPAPEASPGDAVEVWTDDGPTGRRITTAELRGRAGDVATIAVDETDVDALDASGDSPSGDDATRVDPSSGDTVSTGDDVTVGNGDSHSFRLVTLPGSPGVTRAFVSQLRTAEEVVSRVAVEADGPFDGVTVESLPAVVVAIDRGGSIHALPDDATRLESGDVAYVLGRPAALDAGRAG